MNYKSFLFFGITTSLALCLNGCATSAQEPTVAIEPSVSQSTEIQTTPTVQDQYWDDVVELVNLAGDTTTVYKLADGRYLDRMDRFFTYDGVETWACDDGSFWSRKLDTEPAATNVSVEFVIERFLAQRPDHLFFSDGSQYPSKVVFFFDTSITNFRFLQLQGSFDSARVFHCAQTTELYFREEITADELMVVETNLDGLVPTRGISFVDAGGNTCYYYLALSGEDNVPLLFPFK